METNNNESIAKLLIECEDSHKIETAELYTLRKHIEEVYCELFELAWLPMSHTDAIDIMSEQIKRLRAKAGITKWPYTIPDESPSKQLDKLYNRCILKIILNDAHTGTIVENSTTNETELANKQAVLREAILANIDGWNTAAEIYAKYNECPATPSVDEYPAYAARWADFVHGWECSLKHIKKWNL